MFVDAGTFTTSYTDGGTWNTIFAQGFSPSLLASPDPGYSFEDTVRLNRFEFFKSGMDDEAEFIQLAILDNIFYNFFTPLTVNSPGLLGLSDNVLVDTFSVSTGDSISFDFDNVPLNFGGNYGAVFVQQDADGILSPILVSALTANYEETQPNSGIWVPITNYGAEDEFLFSTTNYISEEGFFRSFEFAGDANFIATFDIDIPQVTCDFDFNGVCDALDLDALLYDGILSGNTSFDIDENGTVDLADRDQWLVDGGEKENNGVPYVLGDVDLDGDVDVSDLNSVGLNWQRTDVTSWTQGDFNGDSTVNAADLNSVGLNWLRGTVPPARPVPEPTGCLLLLAALALTARQRSITSS